MNVVAGLRLHLPNPRQRQRQNRAFRGMAGWVRQVSTLVDTGSDINV